MTRRIRRLAPHRTALTLAAVYGLLSAVLVPVGLAVLLFGAPGSRPSGLFMVAAPALYFAVGYVGTAAVAFAYNLAARWTGGVEVTFGE